MLDIFIFLNYSSEWNLLSVLCVHLSTRYQILTASKGDGHPDHHMKTNRRSETLFWSVRLLLLIFFFHLFFFFLIFFAIVQSNFDSFWHLYSFSMPVLGTPFLLLVVLPSLDMRAFALSYCILICHAWLLSVVGLFFCEGNCWMEATSEFLAS